MPPRSRTPLRPPPATGPVRGTFCTVLVPTRPPPSPLSHSSSPSRPGIGRRALAFGALYVGPPPIPRSPLFPFHFPHYFFHVVLILCPILFPASFAPQHGVNTHPHAPTRTRTHPHAPTRTHTHPHQPLLAERTCLGSPGSWCCLCPKQPHIQTIRFHCPIFFVLEGQCYFFPRRHIAVDEFFSIVLM
jgi:hypothetical protein